jgi:hypothetical protein
MGQCRLGDNRAEIHGMLTKRPAGWRRQAVQTLSMRARAGKVTSGGLSG